jgi:hypothetical protein
MSTVQGGQGNIVTNGLVLNLDAANPRSYPQPYNGTTWTDLSGLGNNGTLVSGSAYTGSNGGSIVFDGVDDYASISSNALLNTPNGFTCELWIKFNNTNTCTPFHKDFVYTIRRTSTSLQWADGTNWSYANWSATSPSFVYDTNDTSKWYHIVVTKLDTLVTFYIYGQNVVQKIFGTSGVGAGNTNPVTIGSYNGSSAFANSNIAITRIYNRALNPSEVLQNFNATRARFGI